MDAYTPSAELPPPTPLPPPGAPSLPKLSSRRKGRAPVAMIVALSTAAGGWLLFLFGLLAESDTGRPDGTGCTGRIGEGYQSCMRQSETSGLAIWCVTLGIAAAGLTMLVRSRHESRNTSGSRLLTGMALLASGSLAIAGVAVWVHGASGGFYDALLGSTAWNLAMTAGLLAGVILGFLFTRRRP